MRGPKPADDARLSAQGNRQEEGGRSAANDGATSLPDSVVSRSMRGERIAHTRLMHSHLKTPFYRIQIHTTALTGDRQRSGTRSTIGL